MQIGNRYRCYPTKEQEKILLRWIGCQRFIYNAKVSEDRYYRSFACKFAGNVGQFAPIDSEYSRFIGDNTQWLKHVPSQLFRNAATKWRQAYARFFAKLGGRPTIQKRHGKQSVWLTSELFGFEDGVLNVGTKKFPCGVIEYKTCEPWLIGVRGKPKNSRSHRNLIEGEAREHSRKPEEAYAWCESYLPDVERCELFSRARRPGWDTWGDDLDHFHRGEELGLEAVA